MMVSPNMSILPPAARLGSCKGAVFCRTAERGAGQEKGESACARGTAAQQTRIRMSADPACHLEILEVGNEAACGMKRRGYKILNDVRLPVRAMRATALQAEA